MLAAAGNRNAAYHCQQAAEKVCRAVLAHRGVEATREHRLDVLIALLPADDPWRVRLAPLDRLTPYATTFRYPTPGGRVPVAPTSDVVVADIAAVQAQLDYAKRDLLPQP